MQELLSIIGQMRWQDLVDISLVAFIIYQVLLLLKGTRAMHVLNGLLVVLALFAASAWLELMAINFIISSFLSSLILVLIILFSGEIRRALARLGQGSWWSASGDPATTVEEIVRACLSLASRMTGALIVVERHIGLAEYRDVGVPLDCKVSRELLIQIFQTSGPLHDGAVVISEDRAASARCVLPLSNSPQTKHLGTRHRAALGLSEETDAVCIVVSEERGRVSVAFEGRLTLDLDTTALRKMLLEHLEITQPGKSWLASRMGLMKKRA